MSPAFDIALSDLLKAILALRGTYEMTKTVVHRPNPETGWVEAAPDGGMQIKIVIPPRRNAQG